MQRHNDLEGCAWPDPDPNNSTTARNEEEDVSWLLVDDVSRMSETTVSKIVHPRTEQDVQQILTEAIATNTRIGIRGTQHCMGGQAICRNGIVIDTKFLAHMEYHAQDKTITVGTGCRWADILRYLDPFGKAPKTMQSYCSFSVGGTLAVNAHGITSDTSLAADVVSFRLVRYTNNSPGGEATVESIICTPSTPGIGEDYSSPNKTEAEELFGLVIGGYGLFGVVTEVTLAVTNNRHLHLDSLQLSVLPSTNSNGDDNKSEFERVWESCQQQQLGPVQVKLARLNILNLETVSMYIFRSFDDSDLSGGVSSNLALVPNELSKSSQLLYKWALPVLRGYRLQKEESSGQALDMGDATTTTNQLLFESATPLSKLYSPLVVVNDTFVLQEFFVPRSKFGQWIEAVRPIYRDIENYVVPDGEDSGSELTKKPIRLLNTTIRFVECDRRSFLRYSQVEEGVYAFVLYYRIQRLPEVEAQLGVFHNRLAEQTLQLGGTFYVPYRKCYDQEMLERSYPQVGRFAKLKEKHDPIGIYSNEWFEHYVIKMCSDDYQSKWSGFASISQPLREVSPNIVSSEKFFAHVPERSYRRNGSYRELLANKRLCQEFEEQFLVNIFAIENPAQVMRIISKAAWDPLNVDDDAIYRVLYDHFQQSNNSTPLAMLRKGWCSLRQLSHQKLELTRELSVILHRVGLFGRIQGYVSVGDHGKIVRNLKAAGVFTPGRSEVYIVHNEFDETSFPCILERGSMEPVGQQIRYDYMQDNATDKLSIIPSGSVNLVTMNQGLHHIPREELYNFLTEVYRILQQGGIFVFREHDLGDVSGGTGVGRWLAPISILDLAHSIFNAVTGVSPDLDAQEIRAFRPLEEWRSIMRIVGFCDTMTYGIETGDPTQDFMMCFQKGTAARVTKLQEPAVPQDRGEWSEEPLIAATFRALLAQVPSSAVATVEKVLDYLLLLFPALSESIEKFLNKLRFQDDNGVDDRVEKAAAVCRERLGGALALAQVVLTEFRGLLRDINIRETVDLVGLLSMPEIFLLMPALKRRIDKDPESTSDVEKQIVKFVGEYLPALFLDEKPLPTEVPATPVPQPTVKPPPPSPTQVSPEEVKQVLLLVEGGVHGLFDPAFLPSSGFTLTQQSALIGRVYAPDIDALSVKISDYCNRATWIEICDALVGNESLGDSVVSRGELPTKQRLLSANHNHPWRKALRSFLKSPSVQLRSKALVGLQFIGLSEMVSLYNEAKEEATAAKSDAESLFNAYETKLTDDLMAMISPALKTVTLAFDSGVKQCLRDVGQIAKAEFGYKSLTSSLTDITVDLIQFHMSLQHSQPAGVLPLSEDVLNGFRNKGQGAQVGDAFRRRVVGVGSLGFAGGNVLKISYRPLTNHITNKDTRATEALCSLFESKGVIEGNLHNNPGHFSWFKLAEWMLVDIIEKMGSSLDHTPWYFFPFGDCVTTYFDVLFKECAVVAKDYGIQKAYASQAFITDLIPGVVLAFFFGQLQALSVPFAKFFPLSLESEDIMVEEILVHASLPIKGRPSTEQLTQYFQSKIDKRVRKVTLLAASSASHNGQVCRMVVPTYKTMSAVLVQLGLLMPSARVMQLSGHSVVQVRISVDESCTHLPIVEVELNQMDGVDMLFNYRLPNDHQATRMQGQLTEVKVHLALRVQVLSLLHLIRKVSALQGVQVEQIYELWTGW